LLTVKLRLEIKIKIVQLSKFNIQRNLFKPDTLETRQNGLFREESGGKGSFIQEIEDLEPQTMYDIEESPVKRESDLEGFQCITSPKYHKIALQKIQIFLNNYVFL